jgi:hypothetical protein
MVSWDRAWQRSVENKSPFIQGRQKKDFRYLVYSRAFLSCVPGVAQGQQQQQFTAGAFVLGVTAAANIRNVIKNLLYYANANTDDGAADNLLSATPGNLDKFLLDFSYTTEDSLVANGPTLASALLGSGAESMFPAQELIMPPSQAILCGAQNALGFVGSTYEVANVAISVLMDIYINFHCMVPRGGA